MSFDADLTACAAIVEKGDPERFAAAMASPLAAREILFPLYAFNVEVSRAPWVTQEPMIAEMRLQWWRDALEEIATGKQVRRHEVVTPLSRCLSADSASALDRLVAARRWDIYKDPFEDETHFKNYLTETTATLMIAAATALNAPPDAETKQLLNRLGYCTGLARFLRAVPALEAQNRIPLLDGTADGVAALAQGALADCPQRRTLINRLAPDARPAITEVFLAQNTLKDIAANPHGVADGCIQTAPLKRSFLLWRWS